MIIESDAAGIQGYGNFGTSNSPIGALEITSGKQGILVNSSKATDTAFYVSNLTINAGDDAMQFTKKANTIIADNLDITKAASPINVSGASTKAFIDVTNLNISNVTEAIRVVGGGSLELEADSGNVKSDIVVGEIREGKTSSTGNAKLIFGQGIVLDGKIITDERIISDKASSTNLDFSGTWNMTEASSLTDATFNSGSSLVIEGATFAKDTGIYALNGVGNNATLTVNDGAKLTVKGIDYNTYNIA